jgi:O-antigen/teichoic acid export membrane protein
MSQDSKIYQSIVKSNAVIGGAQVMQMLISILKAKIIAVLLGSAGMGINAILYSTLLAIYNFSSLGINHSAVRNISQIHESGDINKLSKLLKIFKLLVLATGLLGLMICLTGSMWLSKFSFGNTKYIWSFVILSAAVLFMSLANGEITIFKGTRNLKLLAQSSVISPFISLIVSIPFFYFLKLDGIAVSILAAYIFMFLVLYQFGKKITTTKVPKLVFTETKEESKSMIALGIALMTGSTLISLFTYITNIFISRTGSIQDVGLFQGAASITVQSTLVIGTILASDFYPRLSSVCNENDKVNKMVNLQLEIITLVIAPIVVLLMLFTPLIVRLLLSSEFVLIVPMVQWMAFSLLFRGIWQTMSYIILAKGDKTAYFIYDALVGNGLNFGLNLLAYTFGGLTGLSISFVAGSVFVSLILFSVARKRYHLRITSDYLKRLGFVLMLETLAFLSVTFLTSPFKISASIILLFTTILYSGTILLKRLNILSSLKNLR